MEELPHLEPGPNPTSKELLRESCRKGNRLFCCGDEPIPHRGNSCTAGTCSCESRVLCERHYSYGGRRSTQKPSTTPKRAKRLQRYQRYPMVVWWLFGGPGRRSGSVTSPSPLTASTPSLSSLPGTAQKEEGLPRKTRTKRTSADVGQKWWARNAPNSLTRTQ